MLHSQLHIVTSVGIKLDALSCKDPDIYEAYEARLSPSHTHAAPPSTPHAPLFHIPLRLSLMPLSVMQVLQHGPLFTRALTASGWLVNAIIKTIPFQTNGFSDLVPFFFPGSIAGVPNRVSGLTLCDANVTFEAVEIRHSSTLRRALSRTLL